MIRVLYCILDSRFGGPHRLAQTTGRQLQSYGVETSFLLGQKSEDVWHPEGFTSFACRHLQCFTRRRALRNLAAFCSFLPANLLRICKFIRANDIDIVHVDGITNFTPALAAALTRTPIVWHYNDHLPEFLRRLLLRLVRALSSAVIVQGEKLKEVRTGSDAKLHAKTVVLYPGIDLREFDPTPYTPETRTRLREELGIPAESPLIGIIGNMNYLKGHAYFIRAAQLVKNGMMEYWNDGSMGSRGAAPPQHSSLPTPKFLVVGRKLDTDPGYWDQMQQLTAACGLTNDIIFAGFREDAAGILSILDVFVLSSILESCPNVVLEAMAMKVPVVATNVGAVSEMVLDGQTGWVVPPQEADALAAAVLACLTMPQEQVRNMVDAARKRVETTFGADIMARQQFQVYERVLKRDASRCEPQTP